MPLAAVGESITAIAHTHLKSVTDDIYLGAHSEKDLPT